MSVMSLPDAALRRRVRAQRFARTDHWLLGAALTLLALGLVMVTSASITSADRLLGQPFYYLLRQSAYIVVGLFCAYTVWRIPMSAWNKAGPVLLVIAYVLLLGVLIHGVGRAVNGSRRWIPMGLFNLQVSEPAKLFAFIYIAGYLVRRGDEVRGKIIGFAKPMALLAIMCILLLLEPDFGASVVLLSTALGMMFLAGVQLWQFGALILTAGSAFAVLALSSPYRMARLTTFLDPWADPFNSGFQLTQALIAFGRGEWFGVGLGGSIQKLFYLPEAHTDFLFAVLAEELGLVGVVSVIGLYMLLVWRSFVIAAAAQRAEQCFNAFLAYGIGLWIGLQAFVNMGVNMGVLPTKGLTLPLMSFGGSSIVVMCVAVGFLLRIDFEVRDTRTEQHGNAVVARVTRKAAA
ncbi:MAG: putative lipid II flippase FtsW [Gammaproteobacteria bacterium]